MKIFPLLAAYAIILFSACKDARQQDNQQVAIPKALEDKSSGFGFSKRGGEGGPDMVTALCNELADKTPELKALELQIDNLRAQQTDSMKLFTNYAGKNRQYYDAVNMLLRNMHDSMLRKIIKVQIDSNKNAYAERIAEHENLLKIIDDKTLQLDDLHTVLMIVKTLPVIEKYQQTNLPDTAPMSNILTKYNTVNQQVDTLIKK